MTTDRCLAAEEIGLVDDLPAGDERRRHVESCARCRALLRSYREFMSEAPPPATPRERAAREELSAALDREIFGNAALRESETPPASRTVSRNRWWILPRPLVRPALAVASVALVALGVALLLPPHRGADPTGVMRGSGTGADASVGSPHAVVTTRVSDQPQVTWTRVAGADGYEVVVYGADLRELARLDAGADSTLALDFSRLPPEAASEAALFGRIIARRGGDEIGRSNVVTLTSQSR